MRRKFLIFVWVSGVLLTPVFAAMWIRSYFARDELSWVSVDNKVKQSAWIDRGISFGQGQFRFDYRSRLDTGSLAMPVGVAPEFKFESVIPFPAYEHIDGPPADFDRWGFVFDYQHHHDDVLSLGDDKGDSKYIGLLIVIPIGVLMGISGAISLYPVARAKTRAIKRRRRLRRGSCIHCGYDLRATRGRCPECGEPT